MKRVRFNLDKNTLHDTYSKTEYDRHIIDCVLYLKMYNRITPDEWENIMDELYYYKKFQMPVYTGYKLN